MINKHTAAFITVWLFVFSAPVVFAVDTDRASRETDRMISGEAEKALLTKPAKAPEIETAPEKAPLKEEKKKVLIKKINLSGCESFPPEDFLTYLKECEGRELTFDELDGLAKKIEREYLSRGIIAAVFVPPQDIKDNTITLQVVESKMGSVEVRGDKYFSSKRPLYYWQLKPGDTMRYAKIQRSIQAMNKNPDREIKASLHAGTKPDTTDVLLTMKTSFPIHAGYTLDNDGGIATGKWRTGFSLRHNNLLDVEDMLLAGYVFGAYFKGEYIYHNLPVSPYGTNFLYGYSKSFARPRKDYEPYDMTVAGENGNFSVRQDLYNKRGEYTGEAFAGFDAKDKVTHTNTGVLNKDRLRIFSAGGNFILRSFGGGAVISPVFSQGVKSFGGSPDNDPLSSRGGGASSIFSKMNLEIRHMVALPLNIKESLKISGQYSSTKIAPQEEFTLGGIDYVRGYDLGDYVADNGILTNLEFLFPAFFIPEDLRLPYADKPLKEWITPVAFFDYGAGMRYGETKYHFLSGVGGGVRISLYNQVSIRLEWGFPVADEPIAEADLCRFHFALTFQDRLPEEVKRIKKEMKEKKEAKERNEKFNALNSKM